MNIKNAKKYYAYLKKESKKVVNIKKMSLGCNIKENIIIDDFQDFDPLIRFNIDNINFKSYLDDLSKFINLNEEHKTKKSTKQYKVSNKLEYNSLKDYLYDKILLPSGFIDRTYEFNLEDYKIIRKICNNEIKKGKK